MFHPIATPKPSQHFNISHHTLISLMSSDNLAASDL